MNTDNIIAARLEKNAAVTVLGFGISNRPLVSWLLSYGCRVTVRDKKDVSALGAEAEEYAKKGVRFVTGENYTNGIENDEPSLIFRSPGVRPDLDGIKKAVAGGALLTSEMEAFFALTDANIIGVTGSDGKTTTTTLTSLFLKRAAELSGRGHVYVGGNIGEPLLPKVALMTKDDYAVVELSSFQLMTMKMSPARSAITNISRNHLNWHRDYEEYIDAKTNIMRHPGAKYFVTNADCGVTFTLAKNTDLPLALFSSTRHSYADIVPDFKRGITEKTLAFFERDGVMTVSDGKNETGIIKTSEIMLPGRHNLENCMTAAALANGLCPYEEMAGIMRSFAGVEHRLELARTTGGVRYYNSSIDSSPTRTAAALSVFPQKIIAICGGRDKALDFALLGRVLTAHAKIAVLTGECAPVMKKAITADPDYASSGLLLLDVPDFEEAVKTARDRAKAGDIVILSPAATSFDRFANFEERGRLFKDIVSRF